MVNAHSLMGVEMRLPEQVYIKHEPRPVLADFFLAADKFAAERGVLLSISTDFDELQALNRRNRDSWLPMMPSVSPDYCDMTKHQAFWLKGVDTETGETVLARAARLYDLPAPRTLHSELVGMTLFYDHPQVARPFEIVNTTCVAPKGISGRFVLSIAGWHHPSVRKLNLSAVAPRVVRALAYNEWMPEMFISFVEDELAEKAKQAYGMQNQEVGVHWSGSYIADDLYLTLFWMTPAQLLSGLEAFVDMAKSAPSERQRYIAA
jgi:hypothetical protein